MAINKEDTSSFRGDAEAYTPSEEDRKLIAEVDADFAKWKQERKVHEQHWFINAAMLRGQHNAVWSEVDQQLAIPPAPAYRVRITINKLRAKVRAREAKFLKNRPRPQVVPATTDMKDRLDARATQKALEYMWRKIQLESRYREALKWSSIAGHGYWWYSWDENVMGRVQTTDPMTGSKQMADVPLGEVRIEVGSPFEVLIADPVQCNIADQSAVMRIKMRPVEEVRARYPEAGPYVKADSVEDQALRYERQISTLSNTASGSFGLIEDRTKGRDKVPTHVLVKERFERPNAKHPNGRYVVVAGGVLLKNGELPYGFADMSNPYPCTDFPDHLEAGQYWVSPVIEDMVPLQREYNRIRTSLTRHLRLQTHPKVFVPRQYRIAKSAWTADEGEMIEYNAIPHIPPPQPWVPPPIATDVWRSVELINKEFDDVSHIFPESEGRVGESTSGFQTNLLQEATDQVHGPDIRLHEMAIEESAFKIRRLMKAGYRIPRLITIAGNDLQPEMFEFSADDIDEHADIIVEAGSALPTLKGAKIQSVMELWKSGMYGDPKDPEVRQRALSALEMGSTDDTFMDARRDQEGARLENTTLADGQPIEEAQFYENHIIHYRAHTDQLKSPETRNWNPQLRLALIHHIITHMKFMNPQAALQLAAQFGFTDLIEKLQPPAGSGQEMEGGTAPRPPQQGPPPTGPPPQQMGPPPGMMGPPPGMMPSPQQMPPMDMGGEGGMPMM